MSIFKTWKRVTKEAADAENHLKHAVACLQHRDRSLMCRCAVDLSLGEERNGAKGKVHRDLKELIDAVNRGRDAMKIIAEDEELVSQVIWDTGRTNLNPPNAARLKIKDKAPIRSVILTVGGEAMAVEILGNEIKIGCQKFDLKQVRFALKTLLIDNKSACAFGEYDTYRKRKVLNASKIGIRYYSGGTWQDFSWQQAENLYKHITSKEVMAYENL